MVLQVVGPLKMTTGPKTVHRGATQFVGTRRFGLRPASLPRGADLERDPEVGTTAASSDLSTLSATLRW